MRGGMQNEPSSLQIVDQSAREKASIERSQLFNSVNTGFWTNTSREQRVALGASTHIQNSTQVEKNKNLDSLMVDELFVASVDNAKDKDKQYYKGHSIQSTDFDT